MNYQSFLIKYAEIALKGNNRYLFEDALVQRIRHALKRVDGGFRVTKHSGRIYVEALTDYDYADTVDALCHVFGITWICPVVQVPDMSFEELTSQVLRYIDEDYPEKDFTFKVEAKRARKNYPVTSQDMNRELGHSILEAFPTLSVNVHKPDVLLHVEIRDENINIYSRMIKGTGGMPLGTSGKAMLLLSGGIDSPVAGYMIAKRGVFIDAVYFHAPPYTSERAKQKVVDLARIISRYTGPIMLHDELTIIMRRYMMRIAEELALRNECLGLITGESIGQVASQTMQSLAATNDVCTMPVYRPLIAFDKQDIITISEMLGTYETSILPYEDCCTIFVAKHPVTKPRIPVIRKSEEALADVIGPLLDTAYATEEVILCSYDRT